MKILIVINDTEAKYVEYEHTGVLKSPNRRAIEIELTPEQVQKIGLKNTGYYNNGKDAMETIESVSLTLD